MTKLLIDRELLEQVTIELEHDNDRYPLGRELRAILAAPRQPEGEAISRERVQAEADAFFDWPTADRSSVTTTSCLIFARCIAGMVAAERDATIAERDAEIERLRVKLMTIASAEPGRHNIEWAKAMAATGNNESYAKWREAFDQRDKLAGLLREVRVIVAREVERWTRAAAILPVNANVESGLLTRIDAALAEVK